VLRWLKDRRDRARAEREQAAQAQLLAEQLRAWRAESDYLERMKDSLAALTSKEDLASSPVMTVKGEVLIWVGACGLYETRRGATTYVGGSQGISIPIGGTGIRYRVGAIKGQAVAGPDVETQIDVGLATLTSERVVFTGDKATREWDFDKLIAAYSNESEDEFTLHVSNRQKPSELHFPGDGPLFARLLILILQVRKEGLPGVHVELESTIAEHASRRPASLEDIDGAGDDQDRRDE
jgi:hypothetical protein